jgi:hypothetical protein
MDSGETIIQNGLKRLTRHRYFPIIRCLKVLSSEMDPAEIRYIKKAFIKERGV